MVTMKTVLPRLPVASNRVLAELTRLKAEASKSDATHE